MTPSYSIPSLLHLAFEKHVQLHLRRFPHAKDPRDSLEHHLSSKQDHHAGQLPLPLLQSASQFQGMGAEVQNGSVRVCSVFA